MLFIEKLRQSWKRSDSLVCVGLDPDLAKLPNHFDRVNESIFQFNKEIIDATHDLVCAYKPQIAYFSAISAEKQLKQTIDYIKSNYPHIPVILDAKRGDIGSTAEMYATEAFSRYNVDAVTVNPFMGYDSAEPFLKYRDRGVILLCRTSNGGAGDIQDLMVNGMPIYEHLAKLISEKWNFNNNCLLVVGATWPTQMAKIRKIVGDMPFLVPGVGTQGGNIEDIVKSGQASDGTGLIISSSRAILYASKGLDFASAARSQTLRLNNEINRLREQA